MHRNGGRDCHHLSPADGPRGHHHGHPRGRRPFDYGALRLIVLDMIAEAPRHGYELIKAIEERTGGGYSPSPGVIYPTLSWLEDMGYAAAEAEGGRRRFSITPDGRAFLATNHAALADIAARMGAGRHGGRRNAPGPVLEAMDRLKHSLRTRFAGGTVDAAAAEAIAAAIRTAAETVEKTMKTETTTPLTSTAVVETAKAAGYAAQLARHFAHKIPARFEGAEGEIVFPSGICRLHVQDERLTMTLKAATPETVTALQDVVASHLLRFAFREDLRIEWS